MAKPTVQLVSVTLDRQFKTLPEAWHHYLAACRLGEESDGKEVVQQIVRAAFAAGASSVQELFQTIADEDNWEKAAALAMELASDIQRMNNTVRSDAVAFNARQACEEQDG